MSSLQPVSTSSSPALTGISGDDPAEDHRYDSFIADKDVIVMGRGTYESMRDARPWPYTRAVLMLSATLTQADVPEELSEKVRVMDMFPAQGMEFLEAEGKRRVYVDGGLIIQSVLRAGLIADVVITAALLLPGLGRRLFGALPHHVPLVHERTASFRSGPVRSCYRIAR